MSPPSGPPCTPLLIPDIKCALERIPGDKKAFLILMFFSSNYHWFLVRSFNNRSNIFKKGLYLFLSFFKMMGLFLIIPFILAKKKQLFPRNNSQP